MCVGACLNGLKCLKYQTKTTRATIIVITTIAQFRFARFTKRYFISLEEPEHSSEGKQNTEGTSAPRWRDGGKSAFLQVVCPLVPLSAGAKGRFLKIESPTSDIGSKRLILHEGLST
jgi:hypothetical protein